MTLTAAPQTTGVRGPAKLQQLPGLDGLRALAVVAVIVYHLNSSWLPGGFLGVDIFFVISGYLITALLLAEWSGSAHIQLRTFWRRRARRLLPALIALLGLVTIAAGFVARDSLGRLQGDVPASLGYVINWRLLAQHQSYAASLGRPPLLLHLWSLSVEEQFYLLWPLAFILLRKRLRRSRLAGACLGGALASATLMAVFFRAGNPSAVYFGTETHAQGLLIGCALAAAVPPWLMTGAIPDSARRLVERIGAVALAVVILALATFGFHSAVTYRGGMLLLCLASAVLIVTVAHPATRLGPLMSVPPLRWAGLRSYSLYLWHWPIFEMLRPGVDVGVTGWPVQVLRLALTAAAAELSYRYIEQPWRSGQAQAVLRNWFAPPRPWTRWAVVSTPAVAVTVLLASAPAASAPPILYQGSTVAARVPPGSLGTPTSVATSPPPASALRTVIAGQLIESRKSTPSTVKPHLRARTTTTTRPRPKTTVHHTVTVEEPVLAVGDSVLLAASPALNQAFGSQITIDAQVGRQVADGLARLAAYRSAGTLARYRTIMVDLGTNGEFQPSQFAQLVQLVKGIPNVVVFNVHAARSWTATSNSTIASGVAANARQMRMVDWNDTATTPLLYSDGIHPDAAGAGVYSNLLLAAVKRSS